MRTLIAFLTCSLVFAPSAMAQSRGELLYTTHCIACHTTDMHWRDKRSAGNWPALKAQVRRWQDAASLAWSEGDILDVSRYLNESIYHFEQTAEPVLSSSQGAHEPVSTLAGQASETFGRDPLQRQVRSGAWIAVFVGQSADQAHGIEVGRCYELIVLQARRSSPRPPSR